MKRAGLTVVMQLLRAASAITSCQASGPLGFDVMGLVKQLYEKPQPPQIVGYITGGGAQLTPWLLGIAGASQSILELSMPYSKQSLEQILGVELEQYCSSDVARDLAEAAFIQAKKLSGESIKANQCIGLGCTASIRSDPMRRGDHRCHVAVRTATGIHELELCLAKGARSRTSEDAIVSRVALLALLYGSGQGTPNANNCAAFWQVDADEGSAMGSVASEELLHRFIPLDNCGKHGDRSE